MEYWQANYGKSLDALGEEFDIVDIAAAAIKLAHEAGASSEDDERRLWCVLERQVERRPAAPVVSARDVRISIIGDHVRPNSPCVKLRPIAARALAEDLRRRRERGGLLRSRRRGSQRRMAQAARAKTSRNAAWRPMRSQSPCTRSTRPSTKQAAGLTR